MATTDPSPMAEPLQDKKTRNQGKVGPQENGEMFDQKTTRNGNLKGAIVGTKERLVAVLTTGGKENGNIDVDMTGVEKLKRQLKELQVEVVDLRHYRDDVQKIEKERNDLFKALQLSNEKLKQQQELNEKLQLELRDKQHEVMETTKAKEAIETSSQEKIRQLKEQLRSSASVVHQEKAAKEKAWADAVTWRAATERLVEQHSSMEETAREELLHLTERLKELEILCRTVHPLVRKVIINILPC
ncbi:differentially expressed in FDCP 6 homolog isoform X2 [Branchiostoma floridae]|nr:differentially expressed in FDCP 6 homolog isoform X2 [Branchiostoma floridae]